MSQSYRPLDPSLGSSNAPQLMPIAIAMTGPGANTQTAVEEPSAGRFSDEVQSSSTSTGADYPAVFATVENDTQNEWLPGFENMDPLTRRDALNHYLQTPKFTFEGIVRSFLQQQLQNQHEAQKAEREAMEREMRMRSEPQRKVTRLDGQGPGFQPRRF